MKVFVAAAFLSLFMISNAAAAAAPKDQKPEKELLKALNSIMLNPASPPGQSKRPADPDQGDDNASATAVSKVCTKNTPASKRSAICPVPVSP
jgi:hypothetical protein